MSTQINNYSKLVDVLDAIINAENKMTIIILIIEVAVVNIVFPPGGYFREFFAVIKQYTNNSHIINV